MRPAWKWGAAMVLIVALGACGDDATAPAAEPPVVVDTTTANLPEPEVYSGSRGLVIDTRPLVQKGYRPTTVQLSFPDLPELDTELTVDPVTSVAIFRVENDSLSESQRSTLDAGRTRTTIVVLGEPVEGLSALAGDTREIALQTTSELGRSEASQNIDDSNRPVRIQNASLADLAPPVVLSEAIPYAILPDSTSDVITRISAGCTNCIDTRPWNYFEGRAPEEDTIAGRSRLRQDFFFRPVPGVDRYNIVSRTEPGLGELAVVSVSGTEIGFAGGSDPLPAGGAAQFAVVRSPDARVRIQELVTGLFLEAPSGGRWTLGDDGVPFRLLAPRADFNIVNIGTDFNQPVLPPAEVVFASQAVIRNCSAATVEETIGRTETREITRSHATTEALQIFSDSTFSFEHRLALEVERKFSPPGGTGFEGTDVVTVAGNWEDEYSSSSTTANEQVTQSDTTETIEITRERVAVVPPGAAVRVVDVVRTIKNLTVPWTQTLRVRATDRKTGLPLTGAEIQSILRFNGVQAVALSVEEFYLDVTLRGSTLADRFYKTEINATNIPNGCTG